MTKVDVTSVYSHLKLVSVQIISERNYLSHCDENGGATKQNWDD